METQCLIANIFYNDLYKVIDIVQLTNICIQPSILALEWQVQLVILYVLHFYTKCYQQKLQLWALMVIRNMLLF